MATTGVTEGWISKFHTALQVNNVPGENGQMRQAKTIMFSVGSRQSFFSNVPGENGQIKREMRSDFPTFRANGEIAQTINDNLNIADGTGKLISRHVLIFWEEVSYSKDRPITRKENISVNGQLYEVPLNFSVPQTNFIKIVRRIVFLDSNPLKNSVNSTNPTGQAAGTAYPTAIPVAPVYNAGNAQAATPAYAVPGNTTQPVPAAAHMPNQTPYANAGSVGYMPTQAQAPSYTYGGGQNNSNGMTRAAVSNFQSFEGMNPPEELPFDEDSDAGVQAMIDSMAYQAATQSNGLPTPAGLPTNFVANDFNVNGAEAPC